MRSFLFLAGLLLLLFAKPCHSQGDAVSLELKGVVGPAIAEYLLDEFEDANQKNVEFILLLMDTPGGLDSSTRDIIKAILSSSVPIITYVYPDGGRAASAGTYILYASHIAAMSPTTNLGAATPIHIGAGNTRPSQNQNSQQDENAAPKAEDILKKKIINDSAAYIRSLANRHGRNQEWAEQAVREAVSLTADEALNKQVIDIVSDNIANLLVQVHGKEVTLKNGKKVINSKDTALRHIPPSFRTTILQTITHPNIAYILLLLGICGLVYELAHPGFLLPGVAGGISLLLAFYALQVLPVNYSGLALILLGIAFIAAEFFIPSFGALGIGGMVAFLIGSIILFKNEGLKVSPFLVISLPILSSCLLMWLFHRLRILKSRPLRTGVESIIGMEGLAASDFEKQGRIWLMGESWQVESNAHIKKNEKVTITGQKGLTLLVEKLEETKKNDAF